MNFVFLDNQIDRIIKLAPTWIRKQNIAICFSGTPALCNCRFFIMFLATRSSITSSVLKESLRGFSTVTKVFSKEIILENLWIYVEKFVNRVTHSKIAWYLNFLDASSKSSDCPKIWPTKSDKTYVQRSRWWSHWRRSRND